MGKEIALFDAGFGQVDNPRMGWLRDGLAAIGIGPEQVTAGFLSHAHADHLNGFIREGKPVFPNAAIHLLPEELAFWRTPQPDFSKSKRDASKIPGMIREVRAHFDALAKVLQPVRDGTQLFGGQIRVEAAPGHTAGHACFRLHSEGHGRLHLMDLAHHHLLMFANSPPAPLKLRDSPAGLWEIGTWKPVLFNSPLPQSIRYRTVAP